MALRSFPNRYLFSLHSKVTSLFSIRYILEIILSRNLHHFTRQFALHYFTFNYQQRHTHNCFISQRRWYCAIIPMDEFRNINVLTTQLGTSCAFDSPGLARNEPTPGKHSQGDSTPQVLSFLCEGMVIVRNLIADYAQKA